MKCLGELVDSFQKTVVIVTHDLGVTKQCDRVFNLTGGVLSPCKSLLFHNILRKLTIVKIETSQLGLIFFS